MHSDGSFVGRSAPEIDVFEAQITGTPLTGQVSQSGQWGPFNAGYNWFNTSDNLIIYNETITELNPYKGGAFQQATSGVTETSKFLTCVLECWANGVSPDGDCYELGTGCSEIYGFEYKPGFDGAVSSDPTRCIVSC
jgi:beta-glucan synthesis-associated protein KRE6